MYKRQVSTDLKTWSDKYCYFDKAAVTAQSGESFSLVLTGAGCDGDWNPVSVPVEGAKITVDGEATDFVTDADGRVSVTVSEAGSHVISAISDSETLVPPVCVAVIEAVAEDVYKRQFIIIPKGGKGVDDRKHPPSESTKSPYLKKDTGISNYRRKLGRLREVSPTSVDNPTLSQSRASVRSATGNLFTHPDRLSCKPRRQFRQSM